jgi:hypothetical protein
MNDRERVLAQIRLDFPHANLVERGEDIEIVSIPPGICDFCEEPLDSATTKRYAARSCTIVVFPGAPSYESVGDWNACPCCAVLIDEDRRADLLAHALERYLALPDTPENARRKSASQRKGLKMAHDAFFAARIQAEQ